MRSSGTTLTDLPDLCADAGRGGDMAGRASANKKRSSSTCAADWSTTPSTKSLSSSADVEEKSSSGGDADQQCGWGPLQPRVCQLFRNAKVVLFFLCCLATIQVNDTGIIHTCTGNDAANTYT